MNKKILILLLISTVLISANVKEKPKVIKKEVRKTMKIAMIVAKNNFRDEEYLHPKEIFVKSGFEVETFSSSTGIAKGMLGATIKVDKKIDELKVENYDAIVFVGGTGSTEYWDNELAHKIANEAVKQNKVLAAICIAPVTLAKAGVLKGKKATVFSSEIEQLKSYGANYTGKNIEVDGKIVTASGPHAAKEFGEKIKELLLK
jgi:protease I